MRSNGPDNTLLWSNGDHNPAPPHNKTNTSIEAAEKVRPVTAQQRERVYNHVKQHGYQGRTRREIQADLDMLQQSVGPRVWELVKAGRLVDCQTRKRGGCRILVAKEGGVRG